MNHQFDSHRKRSCSLTSWRDPIALSRGKPTTGLAQSVTRRAALKKFGVGLAGMALTCLGLVNKSQAASKKPCLPSLAYGCRSNGDLLQ